MTFLNIERIESSGNITKESEQFASAVELMEVVDAKIIFSQLTENVKNTILENYNIYDNENNIVELF